MSEINLTKKAAKALVFNVTCVASITKAYLVIKRQFTDPDAGAVILTITSSSNSDGQITAAGPSTATLRFTVGAAKLDTLDPGSEYVWVLKCISGGQPYAPSKGRGKLVIAPAGYDQTS